MSSVGAAPRAAVAVSHARAEASRRNGARSRGPKTPEGKARSRLNAIKHGMRAAMHVVLADENALEFRALQEALLDELAPVGALQLVLARRVAVAAWRLTRADRTEIELFEERRWDNAGVGMALIRDGNGTRSFETLMRYRNAAMAEFMRALRTLKALQAEPANVLEQTGGADLALEVSATQLVTPTPVIARPSRPAARRAQADRRGPNEPEPLPEASPERRLEYILPDLPRPGCTLHEPAAPRVPNEPKAETSARMHQTQITGALALVGGLQHSTVCERQLHTALHQAKPSAVGSDEPEVAIRCPTPPC
jgi:hypothetical protein